jgi:hypothetical protein
MDRVATLATNVYALSSKRRESISISSGHVPDFVVGRDELCHSVPRKRPPYAQTELALSQFDWEQ